MKDLEKQAFIYQANGEIIPIVPKNGIHFSLKELQDIVKGYIEIVHLKDHRLMIVNEEGKINNFKFNPEATKLYYEEDYIVGDVLVTPKNYIK